MGLAFSLKTEPGNCYLEIPVWNQRRSCFKTTPKARKIAKVRENQLGKKEERLARRRNRKTQEGEIYCYIIFLPVLSENLTIFFCFFSSSKWRKTGHCSQSSLSRQCRHSLSVQLSAIGGERWGWALLRLCPTTATTSIRTGLDIEILNYRPSYSLRPIHLSLMHHSSSKEKWNFLVCF